MNTNTQDARGSMPLAAFTRKPLTATAIRRSLSAPALAGLLAGVWFVVQTWPWLIHMGSYGIAAPGDGMGGSALWQAMVHEHLNPFAPGIMHAINAPAGRPVTWQINIQQWPTTLIMYALTWVSRGNGEFAFTAYVGLGVVLTAASMAWLCDRLTRDWAAATVIGVGLSLLPFIEIARSGHPAFVHDWTIVGTVGAVWVLYSRPSWKRAIAVGIFVFTAMSWSGYHLLFVTFSVVVVMLGFVVAGWRTPQRRSHLRDFGLVGTVMGVGVAAQYVAILALGGGANPAASLRSFGDEALIVFGARWYEYLVPDSGSILFGSDTRSFFASHLHGSNPSEATLYIGLSVGVLAICGVVAFWRKELHHLSRAPFLVCGALLFVAGVWASLPLGFGSDQFGMRLPTLAGLVGDLTTNWRVFSRFVIVAAVGWFVLGAAGLAWLSRGGVLRRAAVLSVAALAIVLDLYLPNATPSFPVRRPQIAAVLRKLPAGAMAQYPLVRGEIDGYAPMFNEPWYGHPVLNGFDDLPQESVDAPLADLSQAGTVEDLGLLKIRYVLAVKDPAIGSLSTGAISPRLRLIASGMYGPWSATVFEVPIPKDGAAAPVLATGFSPPESAKGSRWQWLAAPSGTISLPSHCIQRCQGTLKFGIASLGPRRHVTFRAQDGKTISQVDAGTPRTVTVPVDLKQTHDIAVEATPGPLPIAKVVPGSTDPRSVSVQVLDIRWIAGRHRP